MLEQTTRIFSENLARALDVEREARSRLKPLKRQAEAAELHARLARQSREARYELARERSMWVLGGTENYYFGDKKSLKNDVWFSADGKEWEQATDNAGWSPRAGFNWGAATDATPGVFRRAVVSLLRSPAPPPAGSCTAS